MLVVAMTSQFTENDYTIPITNNDLATSLLKLTSYIRADKIYSLSQDIAIAKFGKVKPEILKKIRDNVNKLIEIV